MSVAATPTRVPSPPFMDRIPYYFPQPPQNTPGIMGGTLPDGRPRSTNFRCIYTSYDDMVPSFSTPHRVFFNLPVPYSKLWNLEPVGPSVVFRDDYSGVSMAECLGQSKGIDRPNEPAFVRGLLTSDYLSFRLCWPGYESIPWDVLIPMQGSNGSVLTRRELARVLAMQYNEFVDLCLTENRHCADENWKIGKGPYENRFENMTLKALWTPGDGFWRASVGVLKDYTDEYFYGQELSIPKRPVERMHF